MSIQKRALGSTLSPLVQKQALARFVHRFTRDHKPAWMQKTKDKLQFDSDAEWLAHTFFYVTSKGNLDERYGYCESNPTWPDNPELRKKARP